MNTQRLSFGQTKIVKGGAVTAVTIRITCTFALLLCLLFKSCRVNLFDYILMQSFWCFLCFFLLLQPISFVLMREWIGLELDCWKRKKNNTRKCQQLQKFKSSKVQKWKSEKVEKTNRSFPHCSNIDSYRNITTII